MVHATGMPRLGGPHTISPLIRRAMAEEKDSGLHRLSFLRDELAPDLEIIRHLGTGRMAEVYLARQKPLDRLVAVKVLSDSLAEDSTARARFEREAKA